MMIRVAPLASASRSVPGPVSAPLVTNTGAAAHAEVAPAMAADSASTRSPRTRISDEFDMRFLPGLVVSEGESMAGNDVDAVAER
jgi:hypothetical protein